MLQYVRSHRRDIEMVVLGMVKRNSIHSGRGGCFVNVQAELSKTSKGWGCRVPIGAFNGKE